MKKIKIWICLATFLATVPVLTGACTHEEEPSGIEPSRQLKEFPDQESWESTIILTREGLRVAEVWAGYVAVYNKKNQTVLKDSLNVDFYNRAGQHNSVLTAEEGIVDNQSKDLLATGNVIVVSDSGIVLETEELKWDNQAQKIISQVAVKFTTASDTLIGDSFVSDPDLKNYEISNARGYSKKSVTIEK